MTTVKFEDLLLAFDFVSFGHPMEHQAFISLDTAAIYWLSEDNPDEEIPEDLETSDRYIAVPHKYDLDLGRELVFQFAAEELPERYEDVQACFRRRGAYARFKDLLAAEGRVNQWHQFEAMMTEKALTEWCAENDIQVIKNDRESA